MEISEKEKSNFEEMFLEKIFREMFKEKCLKKKIFRSIKGRRTCLRYFIFLFV